MAQQQRQDAHYVVGDSDHERQRLQDQANILNPFTRRLFENAGIGPGMRVLDVGSGSGDVAFLLAEMVGPNGSVVSVDRNGAILETAHKRAAANGYTNVSFHEGDIREVGLDGEFDAVAGRLVLMYLQDPAVAIQATMKSLRSGGIVAFLEPDLSKGSVSTPYIPLVEKIGYWVTETFIRAGVDAQMGLKLRTTYLAAGLDEPQLQIDAVMGGGPLWSGYQYAEDTLRSMLPAIEKFGVATAAEIDIDTFADRYRKEVVQLNAFALMSMWIGAWARKP